MGKATKRERKKTNKAIKDEEQAKAAQKAKILKTVKTLFLILIVPIVIVISILVNRATNTDSYTAKMTVTIEGQKPGVMEIELDYARAPKSVKHFIGYSIGGFYDGLEFHRAAKDFVIQGGDPKGDGTGDLGTKIVAELPDNGYKPGDLAWAKGGDEPAGTAGSQFFIVTGDEKSDGLKALNQKVPQADGSNKYQYGFLGKVTKGISVALEVEALAPKPEGENKSADGRPTKKAIITKVQIFKNGKLVKRGDKNFPAATTTTSATTTTTTAPAESTTTKP